MNGKESLLLFRYNAWSNARILAAASDLTQGQYLAPAPSRTEA